MRKIMPQEMEVWYLLPALRREIVKSLISDFDMNQKEAARIVGVTEAGVSNYMKSKRGSELIFSKQELKKIKTASGKIVKNEKDFTKILYKLCADLKKSGVMCKLHMSKDSSIGKECDACMC